MVRRSQTAVYHEAAGPGRESHFIGMPNVAVAHSIRTAIRTSFMTCKYGGLEYSEGAILPLEGRQLVCRSDQWHEDGKPSDRNPAEPRNTVGRIFVAASVKYLSIIPGSGVYDILVNASPDCLDGMLIFDGRVEWMKIQGYETKELRFQYGRADIVAEKKCI